MRKASRDRRKRAHDVTAVRVGQHEAVAEIRRAMKVLDPKEKQVITWLLGGGKKAEIAKEIGVSPRTVGRLQASASKKMRPILQRRLGGGL